MRLRGKRDGNQTSIVNGLRHVGCSVLDLASVGGSAPDILVGRTEPRGRRRNVLMEIKSECGKLSKGQKEWHQSWKGEAYTVRSLDEALLIMGITKKEKP